MVNHELEWAIRKSNHISKEKMRNILFEIEDLENIYWESDFETETNGTAVRISLRDRGMCQNTG